MKLHHLELTAFGPFAGTERVDFDQLAAAGLFLLRGATGAGKSSVLDAVCYALYGEVPGTRKGNPLRSDHADPALLTRIRLELTLGGRRLEIIRSPEQPRPKRRGAGTTLEKAQTLLREWTADTGAGEPGWRALSTSHQEAGEELRRLIGMSREQFCQVVLLPQGDFARFLRADATERAALLRQLFDTSRFEQVEKWLADQRRAQEAAVTAGRTRLRSLADRTREAAGPLAEPMDPWFPAEEPAPSPSAKPTTRRSGATPDGAPGLAGGGSTGSLTGGSAGDHTGGSAGPADSRARSRAAGTPTTAPGRTGAALGHTDRGTGSLADGVLAWAAILRSNAAEESTVAELWLQAAETAHDGARRAAEETAELADRQRRHQAAVAEADQLAASAERAAEEARRLAAAQAAATVETAFRLHAHATATLDAATCAEQSARAALSHPHSAAEAEALAEAERGLREHLGRLTTARAEEERWLTLGREQERAEAERARVEGAAEDAREWLVEYEGRFEQLSAAQESARAAATTVEQLDAKHSELDERLTAARRREQLLGEIAEAEGTVRTLKDLAQEARSRTLDLRERRLVGMAAELAAQLAPGEPCRVCGSAEHPAPARATEAPVSAEDERRAQQEQSRAESALHLAEGSLTELRVAESAATTAAGGAGAAELRSELAELAEERRTALRAAEELGSLTQQLARLAAEESKRQRGLHEADQRIAVLAERSLKLAEERAELARRVAEARGDAPSVAAHGAALATQAEALASAATAARARTEAAARLTEAEHELRLAAQAAGFAGPAEAHAALLPTAERTALHTRVEHHRTTLARVQDRLTDAELLAAAALPPADLAQARARHDAGLARLTEASARHSAATERCAALARLGAELARLAAELAPELERHGRISRLAALAAGTSTENVLRMRLESYVLAARLEQVAAAASERLVRMSGGRYTLVHSDGRAAGNKRSGLALRVVDAWTGRDRDTATLSGGESFFASLSLALGLADVVTDEAGGRPLDTLFVDEGFGSLDEQALEEVMDVLDGLRERDRAVGIVSHVPDLRTRIPAQLLVRKGRRGSTLRLADQEPG
ncbi:hypothetical protein CFP65_6260 [Kitasatospora sp. MMS16-BH015]|uniref:AAA family ATPase n=1 Tax=Kitasatospora sp. MMS16-BH015 TaxID=2018025 RepID=UPI000CA0CA31|nr:SMC family ATPase [Kitasatospora sp. MMS16-BH015]AUG80923.1 hypothetical protein CFP65_6260 [Kitasatospora sp. MMS16-BH015]